MMDKFRKAVLLLLIPSTINILITISCYITRGPAEFMGYFLGTVLSISFSLLWIIMVKKVTISNPMVLFALSLGTFPVKLIVFALFAFGGYYLIHMNNIYFGFAFLLGTVLSLVIEVWFTVSVNKLFIKQKAEQKKQQEA